MILKYVRNVAIICVSMPSVLTIPSTITTLARAHPHACSSVTLIVHGFAGDDDADDNDQRKSRVSSHSVIAKPWHSRFVFHLKKVGATSERPDASPLSGNASPLLRRRMQACTRVFLSCSPLPVPLGFTGSRHEFQRSHLNRAYMIRAGPTVICLFLNQMVKVLLCPILQHLKF